MRSLIFVITFLAVSPTLAAAQLKPSLISPFTWREAQASEDSELDRLNRAFVQLADHSRPAIVQIRVTAQDAKGNRRRLSAVAAPVSSSTRTGTS
jgi:hypothetical protein